MKKLLSLGAVALLVLATGCVTVRRVEPLTITGVITLAKAGATDAEIIQRLDQSDSVFRLTTADVLKLKEAGVSEPVIDHMLGTYARWTADRERRYYYSWEPYPHPLFWGPPPHPGPHPW